MSKKETYEKYIKHVDIKRVFPNTKTLLEDYGKYFKLYPDRASVDWGEFYTQFTQNWHGKDLEQQDVEYYRDYVFPAVQGTSDRDIEKCLEGLIQKAHVEEIEKCVYDGMDVSKIKDIVDRYEKEMRISTLLDTHGVTVFDLDFSVLDKKDGITWCLPSLQRALLSITLGQLILLSGDTNSGKSSLLKQQVAHTFKLLFERKVDKKILHLNSEGCLQDAATSVFSNIYRKALPGGFEEVVQKRDRVLEKFEETYGSYAKNYILLPMYEVHSVEKLVKEIKYHEPAIVFIDITDALAEEEDPKSLKKVYDELRLMSAQYCPIVATTQAGNQEHYDKRDNTYKKQKWLTDKALYGCKQKGSAADSMIMIGQDDTDATLRYVGTTKRKRGQDVRITCRLHGEYSWFEELTL